MTLRKYTSKNLARYKTVIIVVNYGSKVFCKETGYITFGLFKILH